MLFDLRSRGRRRAVQGIYLSLAVLMGGGLVLFGVGTGTGGGGLLNAFSGGGGSQKAVVSQQEKTALAQVKADPNSASAWSSLLQARWITATEAPDYNANTNTFTSAGKQELNGVNTAWQHYLALTKSPDPDLAVTAARADDKLGSYAAASSAWGQETISDPSAANGFECEAITAYAAKQTRLGDLASAKALTIVPKTQQTSLKSSFQAAKASPSSAQTIAAQGC
jgi:hypothetical protein